MKAWPRSKNPIQGTNNQVKETADSSPGSFQVIIHVKGVKRPKPPWFNLDFGVSTFYWLTNRKRKPYFILVIIKPCLDFGLLN